MARKGHSPEHFVRKLMAVADRLPAEGKETAAVCRELSVSEVTYTGAQPIRRLKAKEAKRLKDLERENSTLKRLWADAELEKVALKEFAPGSSTGHAEARARFAAGCRIPASESRQLGTPRRVVPRPRPRRPAVTGVLLPYSVVARGFIPRLYDVFVTYLVSRFSRAGAGWASVVSRA